MRRPGAAAIPGATHDSRICHAAAAAFGWIIGWRAAASHYAALVFRIAVVARAAAASPSASASHRAACRAPAAARRVSRLSGGNRAAMRCNLPPVCAAAAATVAVYRRAAPEWRGTHRRRTSGHASSVGHCVGANAIDHQSLVHPSAQQAACLGAGFPQFARVGVGKTMPAPARKAQSVAPLHVAANQILLSRLPSRSGPPKLRYRPDAGGFQPAMICMVRTLGSR